MSSRQQILALGFVGLVLLSGCLSGIGSVEQTAETTTATTMPMSATTDSAPTTMQTSTAGICVDGVSFWGMGHGMANRWDRDMVRIGYRLPANADVFFVVFENETALGSVHATTDERPRSVDGDSITLNKSLNGTHTIRVVAFADTNRNDRFDPEEDERCRYNGTVVKDGPKTVDFDSLDASETTTGATNGTTDG